ncbi:MAG: hypothetical protein ACTSVF_00220 [Candidatus Asgardarchaeia archaeon]
MVPIFTGFGWIVNNYFSIHMASFMLDEYGKRLNLRDILKVALLSSTLGVMYDLFTDPVAVALKV